MASLELVMREFETRLASLERVVYAMAAQMKIEVPEPITEIPAPPRSELKFKPEVTAEEVEINATDDAVALAAEAGVDLAEIKGSGKDGRILKADVEKAIS